MAGKFTVDGSVIVSSESVQGLGSELSRLLETATASDFDDDNAGSEIAILRNQASAPSNVENDFWDDTTVDILRHYFGATSQQAWQPEADGIALTNDTGAQRTAGQVVGFTGSVGTFEFDGDSSETHIAGVVSETVENASLGMLRMNGVQTVNVSGAVSRGDFLTRNAGGGFEALSGGTTLDGAFGIALTAAAGPGSGTVTARIFAWNKT